MTGMIEAGITERNAWIQSNTGLVWHILRQFPVTGIEKEELASIGMIGLIKGIDTYNEQYDTRISTYACQCIKHEILMQLRKERSYYRLCSRLSQCLESLYQKKHTIDPFFYQMEDPLYEQSEKKLEYRVLYHAISKLNKREKKILFLRYGFGDPRGIRKSQKETGELVGLSQSYVAREEKNILGKLREEFRRASYVI